MSFRKPRLSRRFRISAISALIAGFLATLAFVAVPSGATFDAQKSGRADVYTAVVGVGLSDPYGTATGTFHLVFNNLKPNTDDATNDSAVTQVFYVKNTGTIPASAKVGMPINNVQAGTGLTPADYAKLLVGVNGATMTPVTSMPSAINLGVLNPGQTVAVTVKMTLVKAAGNEWQNQRLGADGTVTLTQA